MLFNLFEIYLLGIREVMCPVFFFINVGNGNLSFFFMLVLLLLRILFLKIINIFSHNGRQNIAEEERKNRVHNKNNQYQPDQPGERCFVNYRVHGFD